jgi:hypothetical protein
MALVAKEFVVRTTTVRVFPKGCYWRGDDSLSTRLYFNAINASSTCTADNLCLCKECPAYRFSLHATGRYCSNTFDNPKAELVGAKSVEQCQVACGEDASCDYFTFYPAISSAACAPCSRQLLYQLQLPLSGGDGRGSAGTQLSTHLRAPVRRHLAVILSLRWLGARLQRRAARAAHVAFAQAAVDLQRVTRARTRTCAYSHQHSQGKRLCAVMRMSANQSALQQQRAWRCRGCAALCEASQAGSARGL